MPEREPIAEQMPTPNAPMEMSITPWAEIRDSLAEGGTTWLATVRPDGRPHVVPVGALWVDGAYYVTTGQGTVKGNNLDHNPHCVITLSSRGFDLLCEGEAAKVSDVEKLERVARGDADQGGAACVRDVGVDVQYRAHGSGRAASLC